MPLPPTPVIDSPLSLRLLVRHRSEPTIEQFLLKNSSLKPAKFALLLLVPELVNYFTRLHLVYTNIIQNFVNIPNKIHVYHIIAFLYRLSLVTSSEK